MSCEATLIDRQLAQRFLTCARCASFKQAARSLNIRALILRKQLVQLEDQLGGPLFLLQNKTLRLTLKGQRLQAELIQRFGDLPSVDNTAPQPVLRLALPDVLLQDILSRDLLAFVRKNAGVSLELIALETEPTQQVEVMLWLADPHRPRPSPGFSMSTPQLLARIGYSAHIAKRYSRKNSLPTRVADLNDYMVVQERANLSVMAFAPWNQLSRQRTRAVTLVHCTAWVRDLVRSSACVGLLPDYTTHLDKNLLALTPLFNQRLERLVWLSTAPLTAQQPQVKAMIALIRKAFEEREDWFVS